MLVEMAKVEIIGPKHHFLETVSLVHDLGDLHIEEVARCIADDVPIKAMRVEGEAKEDLALIDDQLVRVRGLVKALDVSGSRADTRAYDQSYEQFWGSELNDSLRQTEQMLGEIEGRVSKLAAEATDIEHELALLDRYAPVLEKVAPLARQVMTTGAFDAIALSIEKRYKDALSGLEEEIERITGGQSELITTDVDDETTAAILVYAREHAPEVHKMLADANVNQIRLPSELADRPFDEAFDEIAERRRTLPPRLKMVRSELEHLSSIWYTRLLAARDVLVDRGKEIDAICEFGQTEYAFVITGWMPESEFKTLTTILEDRFAGEVIAESLEVKPENYKDVPVALTNTGLVSPYEGLLSISGAPRYGTIDPTLMVAFFYPLFFGMIVGDVGYGLIMVALVLWLRFKYKDIPWMRQATSILGPACTMAVAFGFLYGEFFGNLGMTLGIVPDTFYILGVPLPFNRLESVPIVMVMAILVGFIQVSLGLALGIVNAVHTKSRSHMFERAGLLLVLFAVPILIVGVSGVLSLRYGPIATAIGSLLLGVGAFFAIKGGKAVGAVEIVGQFGNVFSYLRIMAVGLAGAIFAEAANEITEGLVPMTGWWFAIFVGVVLHSLNIAISAFSPNIHALRLNFLEFFSKFYESGTRQYAPFHRARGEEHQ